jgi:hypothetical protein
VESSTPRRILIVAYRTAATPALIEAVRQRAARGSVSFTLLVPRPYWDPDTEEAALTLELALPLLDEAVGDRVEGLVGDPDPFVAVRRRWRASVSTRSSSPRCPRASRTGCGATCPRAWSSSASPSRW